MKPFIPILLLATSLSAQTIPIGGLASQPALAASRTQILATWVDNQRLRGELLDFNGQVTAGPFDLPASQAAAIVTDGERFLVYWSNGTNVEGTFIGNGERFTIVPDAGAAMATFDGSRFVFFSQQGTTIRATPLGDASFDVVQNATLGSVASHDGITAVTWTQSANQQWTAGVTFVTGEHASAPSVVAALDITSGFGQTFIISPAVAWNGSDWYIVWHSGRSGRIDRYEGTILSGNASVIDDDYFTGKAHSPRILSIGSQFLVTWTRDSPASDEYVGRYVSDRGEAGTRISLSYHARGIGSGATIALPDGTLVSFVAPLIGDAFIRFGRVARRRVAS